MKRATLLLATLAAAVYAAVFYAAHLPSLEDRLHEQSFRRIDLLMVCLSPEYLGPRLESIPVQTAILARLAVAAAAAAIVLWGTSVGGLLLRLCRLHVGLSRLELFVFATAVGLNAISTYLLAVGLLGLLHCRWVVVVPAVLTLTGAAWLWRSRTRQAKVRPPSAENTPPVERRWLWLTVPFLVLIVLGAMMPPRDFDVCEYHLQAPKEFYQQGRITFLPHNVYANMPLGSEMLSLAAMVARGDWWWGALVGKTAIALFTGIAALGLFAAGRRICSPTAGAIAALLYVSTPWILLVSTSGLVDGAVGCYLLTAVFAVLLWTRSDAPHDFRRSAGLVGLAGYLAGAAVACKYPAVLFVVIPLAAWITLATVRQRWSLAWRTLAVYFLAVLLGCGLWLGKNGALAGNPTYPLLYEVFGGQTRTAAKNDQWNHAHRPHNFSAGALAADLERVTLGSEWLSPLLMPLAALSLLRRRQRPVVLTLMACFAFIIAAWWLWTHRIDRFWVPALPLVALLAGLGACWSGDRPWLAVLLGFILFGTGANFLLATSGVLGDCRWLAPWGDLRRDPQCVRPWHRYFNKHVRNGRLLMIGDAAVFDLEVPTLYSTCFDDSPFELLAAGRSAAEIRSALIDFHVSYVYVDWDEVARYRQVGNYGFTRFIQPSLFAQLVNQGVLEPLPEITSEGGRGYRVCKP